MKITFIITWLAVLSACDGENARVQNTAGWGDDQSALPAYIYGACDAYVVMDRDKDIDLSSAGEFYRPAVFRVAIKAGVPAVVEMLMLASNEEDDSNLLYPQSGGLLRVEIAQQSDIQFKDGERMINRYRGNSAAQQDSIDIDWYADADKMVRGNRQGTERVVRVDVARDPYENDVGVRRWGKHYVCHRNVGINALDLDSYDALVNRGTPPQPAAENQSG